jgi:hypothetical protein
MRLPPDPDDPVRPAAAGVRPFLRTTAPGQSGPPARAEAPGEQTTSLRPFVITAGRVSGVDPEIGLETQVTTITTAALTRLSPEMRAIVTLCVEPLSVAEISARLKMHFGVTRVLVGDLRAAGQLDVHVLETEFPDPDTIMRVIRGLRAIS